MMRADACACNLQCRAQSCLRLYKQPRAHLLSNTHKTESRHLVATVMFACVGTDHSRRRERGCTWKNEYSTLYLPHDTGVSVMKRVHVDYDGTFRRHIVRFCSFE